MTNDQRLNPNEAGSADPLVPRRIAKRDLVPLIGHWELVTLQSIG